MARASRRFAALLDPAADGAWTLPTAVVVARETLSRVTDALTRVPDAAQDPTDVAVRAAMEAKDPLTVDLSALLDHPREVARRDALIAVLRAAEERADSELTALVHDHRDEIITGHLRPAGEALWSEIVKAVKSLGEVETTDN
jgi:hypothetical protein